MDQAVLACVKSYQKKKFYYKMFQYCENHPDEPKAFNEFLKSYTILEAIKDIEEGWRQVPQSTIEKSFRKVFPKDKWDELTGGTTHEPDVFHDFEGFGEADHVQPIPTDNLPGHNSVERTQVINASFESDIDEIVRHLNNCLKDVFFQKEHVVEDVLAC